MAQYVYACKNKEHPRVTVVHSMGANPTILCDVCKKPMHRVPQGFRFYMNPISTIREWSEQNWSRKLRGEKRQYDTVDVGRAQKNYDTRSK